MTMGEQRHMAVTEHELSRIADALERIAKCLEAKADRQEPCKVNDNGSANGPDMDSVIEDAWESSLEAGKKLS